jgi:hypothetical protein
MITRTWASTIWRDHLGASDNAVEGKPGSTTAPALGSSTAIERCRAPRVSLVDPLERTRPRVGARQAPALFGQALVSAIKLVATAA